MKIKKSILVFCIWTIILLVFLGNTCYAEFQLGNGSTIESTYSASDVLRGKINLSFQLENAISLFTSNLGGGIGVLELLKKNNAHYTCLPSDCKEGISAVSDSGSATKSFSLEPGQEKFVSFYIGNGNVESIEALNLGISAINQPSCNAPLEIDFLNDGKLDYNWKSTNTGTDYSCTAGTPAGCFEFSSDLKEAHLGTNLYCERVTLPVNNKFLVGARVRKGDETGSPVLKMYIYNLSGISVDSDGCELLEPGELWADSTCVIDYSGGNKAVSDHYVCIKASASSKYDIQYELDSPCGFTGTPSKTGQNYTRDFYLFAKAPKYESVGSLNINRTDKTSGDILSYLSSKYSKNCAGGCTIPVKFKAYSHLDFQLSNINMDYYANGLGADTKEIYDVELVQAKVNSNFSMLDLSYANITLPSRIGNQTIALKIGEDIILTKQVAVSSAQTLISVSPTTLPANYPTKFAASAGNITSYKWDFGDGSLPQTTSTNWVMHSYPNIGDYVLSLEVTSASGKYTKSFQIKAVNPEAIVNATLKDYDLRINAIEQAVGGYPSWYMQKIKDKIGLTNTNTLLSGLRARYSTASEQDMVAIMGNLSSLRVPRSINKTRIVSPYFIDWRSINPALLEELGAGSIEGRESNIKTQATLWAEKNVDVSLEIELINLYYDSGIETIYTVVKVKLTPKQDVSSKVYFVIEGKDITAKDAASRTFTGNAGIGSTLDSLPQQTSLEFAMPGIVTLNKLNMYLSPDFSELGATPVEGVCNFDGVCDENETVFTCFSDCYKKKIWQAVLMIVGILVLAGLIYLGLHLWYKTRYESHLFKNRANLFNILNFIHLGLSKGLSKAEVKAKLKQAGWTGEQIGYAFKKSERKSIMPLSFSGLKTGNSGMQTPTVGTASANGIKRRNAALVLIFTIISLGIYGIYWIISTSGELRRNTKSGPSTGLFLIILGLMLIGGGILAYTSFSAVSGEISGESSGLSTLFIVGLVFILGGEIMSLVYYWKYSSAINELTGFSSIGMFLLWLFLSPVAIVLAQLELNKKASM